MPDDYLTVNTYFSFISLIFCYNFSMRKRILSSEDYRYKVWSNMKDRCNNKRNPKFYCYGGRGITVCNRWNGKRSFNTFCRDMGERPIGYVIDRIDNEQGYKPINCRWVTKQQSLKNRRKIEKKFRLSKTAWKQIALAFGIKKCSCCKQPLPVHSFSLSRGRECGRQSACNRCLRSRRKGFYETSPVANPGRPCQSFLM
jgi:hypothetical protein